MTTLSLSNPIDMQQLQQQIADACDNWLEDLPLEHITTPAKMAKMYLLQFNFHDVATDDLDEAMDMFLFMCAESVEEVLSACRDENGTDDNDDEFTSESTEQGGGINEVGVNGFGHPSPYSQAS